QGGEARERPWRAERDLLPGGPAVARQLGERHGAWLGAGRRADRGPFPDRGLAQGDHAVAVDRDLLERPGRGPGRRGQDDRLPGPAVGGRPHRWLAVV